LLEEAEEDDSSTLLLNWSGTHSVVVPNDRLFEPETEEELETIVKHCNETKTPIRPLGSALSPNGIGFHPGGMVSLTNLDKVVAVDKENMTVTVQAGARVSQVVDALRPHGLTLPNLASIAEQQMGGFVQVGAHGTGAKIAPVDHYVTSLKLVTPAKGTMTLTEQDGVLFHLAKVGLGCLGVVSEVTMKCIPAHRLVERTFVLSRKEAVSQLDTLLRSFKHVRYMWIPYEDAVVVVTNDPEDTTGVVTPMATTFTDEERFRPLKDLLVELTKDNPEPFTPESMKGMAFGELRDALLAVSPLDVDHVKKVNAAEAEFWRRSEGFQIKPSDELLQFDCGGQVRIIVAKFLVQRL
jgi:L-galactono-1,4-lactone dehydrogenase